MFIAIGPTLHSRAAYPGPNFQTIGEASHPPQVTAMAREAEVYPIVFAAHREPEAQDATPERTLPSCVRTPPQARNSTGPHIR